MINHTRLHHFECCYLQFFGTTASKHSSHAHVYRRHELSKIQPKEWATALALKHVLVSWDLWTYCIGFKLIRVYRHHHIFTSRRRDDTIQYDAVLVSSRDAAVTYMHTTAATAIYTQQNNLL